MGPDDEACHGAARTGRTPRNAPLFGPPGTVYVYLAYGVHWLTNLVTGDEGFPAGVLLRAVEPLTGLDIMRSRRGRPELTNGPGRLSQALGVGPELQGVRADGPPLTVLAGDPVPEDCVRVTPRIGISRARDLPLRFFDSRSRWVSLGGRVQQRSSEGR